MKLQKQLRVGFVGSSVRVRRCFKPLACGCVRLLPSVAGAGRPVADCRLGGAFNVLFRLLLIPTGGFRVRRVKPDFNVRQNRRGQGGNAKGLEDCCNRFCVGLAGFIGVGPYRYLPVFQVAKIGLVGAAFAIGRRGGHEVRQQAGGGVCGFLTLANYNRRGGPGVQRVKAVKRLWVGRFFEVPKQAAVVGVLP